MFLGDQNFRVRPGVLDFGGKRSVLSRICRGDPMIDKAAHVSGGQGSSVERRPSAKIVNSSEVRIFLTRFDCGREMFLIWDIICVYV